MKLSSLLPSSLLATSISAQVAHIYLSDVSTSPQPALYSPVSPSTARLIFAQRLDLAQYHRIGDADADTIRAVNSFGGTQKKLFGGDEEISRPKVMLVFEGVESIEDVIPAEFATAFPIDNPPEASSNERLLRDFADQGNVESTVDDSHPFYSEAARLVSTLGPELRSYSSAGQRFFVHSNALKKIASRYGATSKQYKQVAAAARSTISAAFAKAANSDWDVIVAVMPRQSGSGIFKRTTPSTWGGSSLPKRQLDEEEEDAAEMSTDIYNDPQLGSGRPDYLPSDFAGTSTNNEALDSVPENGGLYAEAEAESTWESEGGVDDTESFVEKLEELLEEIIDELTPEHAPAGSSMTASLANDTVPQIDTTPPRGILPACYSTLDTCLTTTHNCSGHGTCSLRYTNRDATAGSGACYQCGCSSTRRVNADGTFKTTLWSGPACQKQDVSMPFWLLGGLTVGLVSVVAWGIGLLYTMGSQDLPSVIGAGVAGPRAKQ